MGNTFKLVSMRKDELTQHSQRNLDVIENFILHITHCSNETDEEFMTPQTYTPEELYKLAYEYILEDHVDGEDSEEAYEEKVQARNKMFKKFELIGEEIFLSDDESEENPIDLYCDSEVNPTLFAVPRNPYKSVRRFILTKPQSIIEVHHRWEILEYVLGKPTDADEVSLKDIFMHGKYVTEILDSE